MFNKDLLEKALLIGVVNSKNWQTIILNNITIEYFSYANHELYHYVEDNVMKGQYPDLSILCYNFGIDDIMLQDCLSITDLDGLCDTLRKEYLQNQIEYRIKGMNDHIDEMNTDPKKYIERIGDVYNELKILSQYTKSVSLFENIEDILKIDATDVITTGFKELDEKLVGWKRGEELVVFMARTGQRQELDGS